MSLPPQILDSELYVGFESFSGSFPSKDYHEMVAVFEWPHEAQHWKDLTPPGTRRLEAKTLGDILVGLARAIRNTR